LDNVYLGSVRAIIPGPTTGITEQVVPEARQSSVVNGEHLGPMPTQTIGNAGPHTQSAAALYATQPDSAQAIGRGILKVGKWWGLGHQRSIPMEAIQTVSFERVVLKQRKADLDQSSS
jgi:hypothetical protein